MNAALLLILQRIIAEQGETVLAEAKRVRAYLSDYGADIPGAEKNALVKCLEYGFCAELKNALPGTRDAVKDRLARRLRDEEGLDAALCAGSVGALETALFGESPPEPAPDGEQVTAGEQRGAGEARPFHEEPPVSTPGGSAVFRNLQGGGEEGREAALLKIQLYKTNRGLTAAIIIGILALFISIGIGLYYYNRVKENLDSQVSRYYSLEYRNRELEASYEELRSDYDSFQPRYDELQSRYNTLQSSHNTLQSQHKTLQSNYDALLKNWTISVTSISVGNTDYNRRWITRAGGRLNASEIRYLTPVISYNSQISREVTLYVKIINPDGTVRRNSENSPQGYSYSTEGNVVIGNNRTWELSGWGNSDQSTYSRGNHRVEVWYQGIRLGTASVTLN
ncbi:MAG: hypothetical protein LBH26_07535 [Treponema sp.]|jgi:type II secretory pathway pseudopilin PulG|nr:hypothetical protein [Treponema sp.]